VFLAYKDGMDRKLLPHEQANKTLEDLIKLARKNKEIVRVSRIKSILKLNANVQCFEPQHPILPPPPSSAPQTTAATASAAPNNAAPSAGVPNAVGSFSS